MSAPGLDHLVRSARARLGWRDVLAMMTAGKREHEKKVASGVVIVLGVMHVIAYFAVRSVGEGVSANLPTLIAVTAGIILSGSAMLSQAMESVTRTFYTRSDLELILSSPAEVGRLFAVRIGAIAVSVGVLSLVFIGPIVNILAWRSGVQWLAAYGVMIALSAARHGDRGRLDGFALSADRTQAHAHHRADRGSVGRRPVRHRVADGGDVLNRNSRALCIFALGHRRGPCTGYRQLTLAAGAGRAGRCICDVDFCRRQRFAFPADDIDLRAAIRRLCPGGVGCIASSNQQYASRPRVCCPIDWERSETQGAAAPRA